MSTGTAIQWTDHTFSPWWGCAKVHSGCANCYAESLDHRWGGNHWGKDAPRRMVLGEWGKPAKWNRDALATFGRRARVFCASMCDLFENFDGPVVDQQGNKVFIPSGSMLTRYAPKVGDEVFDDDVWTVPGLRRRVFDIIETCRNLDFQLLTKRPENVTRMVPWHWMQRWPENVLVGTSPCDQKTADECIPHLLAVPGRRFLSCEPLLGTLSIPGQWMRGLDWVIVGCESNGARAGRNADHYHTHAAIIIGQCLAAGVPVFHKQMPIDGMKSGEPSEWPAWARYREFPTSCKGEE